MKKKRLSLEQEYKRKYRNTLIADMRKVIEKHESIQTGLFQINSFDEGYEALIHQRSHIEARYAQLEEKIKAEWQVDNIYDVLDG